MPTVATIAPLGCMPWHLRASAGEPVRGGECRFCGREIAVPVSAGRRIVGCIYCGLDRGFVPAAEVEPDRT